MFMPVVGASVGSQTMLQARVPDRYRGRVYGALSTTMAILSLASVAFSGAFAEIFGIVPMLTVAGCVTILAGILALFLIPRAERHGESTQVDQGARASV